MVTTKLKKLCDTSDDRENAPKIGLQQSPSNANQRHLLTDSFKSVRKKTTSPKLNVARRLMNNTRTNGKASPKSSGKKNKITIKRDKNESKVNDKKVNRIIEYFEKISGDVLSNDGNTSKVVNGDDKVILDKKGESTDKKNDAFQVLMMSKGDAPIKTPGKEIKRLRKKSTKSTERSKREKDIKMFSKINDKKK